MKSVRITRSWHGTVKKQDGDTYLEYLIESGITDYRSIPEILNVEILRRIEGEVCHFHTVTQWKSYEDIKAFSGEDYTKAKYYPKDKEFLLELEEEVQHFETFIF